MISNLAGDAKSVETAQKAIQIYKDFRKISKMGGFNLLRGICNSNAFTIFSPDFNRSSSQKKISDVESLISPWLEMQCNVDSDILEVLRVNDKTVPDEITLGAVSSFLASVFKPLGLFAPLTRRRMFTENDAIKECKVVRLDWKWRRGYLPEKCIKTGTTEDDASWR